MINNAEKEFLTVRDLLREGKAGESLEQLNLVLTRYPDFGKAQAFLGHIHFRYFRDYVKAEEILKAAMVHSAHYDEVYYDYAELLLVTEKYTETVAVLNKSLEVSGIKKEKIYLLFGKLYERQGRYDEAVEYYNKGMLYTFSIREMDNFQLDIERCIRKKNLI